MSKGLFDKASLYREEFLAQPNDGLMSQALEYLNSKDKPCLSDEQKSDGEPILPPMPDASEFHPNNCPTVADEMPDDETVRKRLSDIEQFVSSSENVTSSNENAESETFFLEGNENQKPDYEEEVLIIDLPQDDDPFAALLAQMGGEVSQTETGSDAADNPSPEVLTVPAESEDTDDGCESNAEAAEETSDNVEEITDRDTCSESDVSDEVVEECPTQGVKVVGNEIVYNPNEVTQKTFTDNNVTFTELPPTSEPAPDYEEPLPPGILTTDKSEDDEIIIPAEEDDDIIELPAAEDLPVTASDNVPACKSADYILTDGNESVEWIYPADNADSESSADDNAVSDETAEEQTAEEVISEEAISDEDNADETADETADEIIEETADESDESDVAAEDLPDEDVTEDAVSDETAEEEIAEEQTAEEVISEEEISDEDNADEAPADETADEIIEETTDESDESDVAAEDLPEEDVTEDVVSDETAEEEIAEEQTAEEVISDEEISDEDNADEAPADETADEIIEETTDESGVAAEDLPEEDVTEDDVSDETAEEVISEEAISDEDNADETAEEPVVAEIQKHKKYDDYLSVLDDISAATASVAVDENMFDNFLMCIAERFEIDGCSLLLFDPNDGLFKCMTQIGYDSHTEEINAINLEYNNIYNNLANKKSYFINKEDSDFAALSEIMSEQDYENAQYQLWIPFVFSSRIIGIMMITHSKATVTDDYIRALEVAGRLNGATLYNLYQQYALMCNEYDDDAETDDADESENVEVGEVTADEAEISDDHNEQSNSSADENAAAETESELSEEELAEALMSEWNNASECEQSEEGDEESDNDNVSEDIIIDDNADEDISVADDETALSEDESISEETVESDESALSEEIESNDESDSAEEDSLPENDEIISEENTDESDNESDIAEESQSDESQPEDNAEEPAEYVPADDEQTADEGSADSDYDSIIIDDTSFGDDDTSVVSGDDTSNEVPDSENAEEIIGDTADQSVYDFADNMNENIEVPDIPDDLENNYRGIAAFMQNLRQSGKDLSLCRIDHINHEEVVNATGQFSLMSFAEDIKGTAQSIIGGDSYIEVTQDDRFYIVIPNAEKEEAEAAVTMIIEQIISLFSEAFGSSTEFHFECVAHDTFGEPDYIELLRSLL